MVVNDRPVKANYKVRPGDIIRLLLPYAPYRELLKPEDIPLDIVYEDDDVLVVNKPAGMVVHPAHGHYSGTLINAVLGHVDKLPQGSADERPGLVHRIDKDTTGLLVVAKNELAMNKLAKQFADKTTERKYIALVWGDLPADQGTITGHIGRHPRNASKCTFFPTEPRQTFRNALQGYWNGCGLCYTWWEVPTWETGPDGIKSRGPNSGQNGSIPPFPGGIPGLKGGEPGFLPKGQGKPLGKFFGQFPGGKFPSKILWGPGKASHIAQKTA